MKIVIACTTLRAGVLLCLAFLVSSTLAHSSSSIISLDPSPSVISLDPAINAASTAPVKGEASFANPPANFHSFPSARVGENSLAEQLTLHFAASTELTRIESTKDFSVEPGGTCATGNVYTSGASCTLLVRFAPQGAGRRLGKLTITHTAAAEPLSIGLGGNGYAPIVSFTPALISTVPGTFPASKGLLSSAQNLTVDGGDIVYIADTGNDTIRKLDSSGTLVSTVNPPIATPASLAVDNFGIIYTANTHGSTYYFSVYFPWGSETAYGYAYAPGTCTPGAPCPFSTVGMSNPANVSIDTNNDLFMEEGTKGALEMPVGSISGGSGAFNLWYLSDQFAYSSGSPGTFAVDANDNLYTFYTFISAGTCYIIQEPLYNAEYSPTAIRVAGAAGCGFAGDGGQARDAEIGSAVGQIAFDIAGDLYFSDTTNQRVRRINTVTGIINTIAGTGTAGYTGDGGAATSAELSSPTGVGVDSQGQVYIISAAAASGTAQAVRKLGPNGFLSFGSQLKGSASAAEPVTVANIGNATLTLTNAVFTGTNPGDFSVDPNTTSCNLAAGATLNAGQSCKVGVLFKPSAAGSRSANFVLLDNTATNSNTVQLAGTGTLPAPTFTITSPAPGTSVVHGTAVKFAVSVTSASPPVPTGTVKFAVNNTAIGSPVALSSGAASVTVTEATAATYTLSATYSGDANYSAAGPISRTLIVTAAASTTKLESLVNPAMECRPVEFSVNVTGTSGTQPTGKVELKKGGNVLAAASLSNGGARLSTSALTVGTNVLTASYLGDARNRASTSAPVTQEILSSGSACGGVVLPNPL